MEHDNKYKKGQAMVSLLFFCLVGLTVAISSIFILISNSKSATQTQVYQDLISASESGVEIAMVGLLRDPEYLGETVVINDINLVINVSGSGIQSVATEGLTSHTTNAQISYNDNRLELISWTQN